MTDTLELRSNGIKCCPECGSDTCCGSIHCPEHDEMKRENKLIKQAEQRGIQKGIDAVKKEFIEIYETKHGAELSPREILEEAISAARKTKRGED